MKRRIWLMAGTLLVLGGCGVEGTDAVAYPEPRHEALDMAPSVGTVANMTQTVSGLRFQDLEEGEGAEAAEGADRHRPLHRLVPGRGEV